MTKQELIDAVAEKTGETKAAVKGVIEATFDQIAVVIKKEERFQVPGFGTFTLKKRAARKGINPKTKEQIKIKASKSVGFKPAPQLKKAL